MPRGVKRVLVLWHGKLAIWVGKSVGRVREGCKTWACRWVVSWMGFEKVKDG